MLSAAILRNHSTKYCWSLYISIHQGADAVLLYIYALQKCTNATYSVEWSISHCDLVVLWKQLEIKYFTKVSLWLTLFLSAAVIKENKKKKRKGEKVWSNHGLKKKFSILCLEFEPSLCFLIFPAARLR